MPAFAAAPDANYRLLFADEFNGTSLDTRKWGAASPSWTMPNAASTASSSMVSVANGELTLGATRNGSANTFTSGSISSYQKFTYSGGYVEAKIFLPSTVGSWPAFWGLYTGWPPEADIMEYPLTTNGGASGLNADQYSTNFHYKNASGGNSAGAGVVNPSSVGDLRGSYHTFGMDWTAGTSTKFYFDGALVSSFTNSAVAQMANMYMILDYAVGGWPGTPSLAQWPANFTDQMKVDYVRLYQFNSGDPAATWTGSGAWDTASNWSINAIPRFSNQTVTFGGAGSSAVSIGGYRVIGGMTFTGGTGYTIGSSTTSLQLASTTGTPLVQAQATSTASQTINSKVELWNDSIIRNLMTGGQTLAINGAISGNGRLTADGTGTVILAGSNSYTGGTTLSAGTLLTTTPTALGTGILSLGGGATLIVRTDGGDTPVGLTMGAGNTATIASDVKTGGVGLSHNLGAATLSTITMNVVAGPNVTSGNAAITLGSISLSSGGGGTTTFNPTSAALMVGPVTSISNTVKTLSLGGTNANNSITGGITNGVNVVSLNKQGTSVWTLAGSNTFTGATAITAGKLILNNAGLPNTSGVTLSSGATLTAKGSLTTGGLLNAAGTVDLADGAINTLTVTGGLTLNNALLNFDLGASTADKIAASGAASVTGTDNTLNLTAAAGQSMSNGTTYTVMTATGGLSASNFKIGTKPASLGFYTFTPSATGTELRVAVSGAATPATAYWTGRGSVAASDTGNNWGSGAGVGTSNWTLDAAGNTDALQLPGSTTNVVFNAANASGSLSTQTTQLDSSYSVKGLLFDVPASPGVTSCVLNMGTNVLTVGTGGVSVASTSNAGATLSGTGGVLVNGTSTWANNSNAVALNVTTIVKPLAGAGTLALNGTGIGGVNISGVLADGTGTLSTNFNQAGVTVLSANNTYTGTTTVGGGIVQITNTGRLISNAIVTGGTLMLNAGTDSIADTATVNVQAGGTLDIRETAGVARTESLGALTGNGIVSRGNSGLTTLTVGPTDLSGTFSGSIQNGGGTLALVKSGVGTLVLAGSSSYTGGTTLAGGIINAQHNNAFGPGVVNQSTGTRNAAIQLQGGITIPNTVSFLISNDGTGTVPYAILNVGGNNTINGPITLASGGGNSIVQSDSGALVLAGNITIAAGQTSRALMLEGTSAGANAVNGTISDLNSGSVTSVIKNDEGAWQLAANNNYTGGTVVNGGTLTVTGNNTWGTGGLTVNDGVAWMMNSNIYTANTVITGDTVGGTNGGTVTTGGRVVMAHPNALGTGAIFMSGNATLEVTTDGGDYPYQFNIGTNNTVNLVSGVKTGTAGINHTLGNLFIGNSDTVNVTAADNITSGNPAITLGVATLSSGFGTGSTTFNPTTASIILGSISTSTAGAKTVVLDGTSLGNKINGTVADGANVVALYKSNASTWQLGGSSTFTGGTTIADDGGALLITNGRALGTGAVSIGQSGSNKAGKLQLAGNINLTGVSGINIGGRFLPAAGGLPTIENVSGVNTISVPVTFSTAGGNAINFVSSAGSITLAGALTASTITGARFFEFGGAGNGVVSGAITNGSATIGVVKDDGGAWALTASNSYTGTTTVNAGTLQINRFGAVVISGSPTFPAAATVNTGGTLKLSAKSTPADPSGTSYFPAGSLVLAGTFASPTARLDVTNNAVILQSTSQANAESLVKSGYAGGTWTGQGIASSTAANIALAAVGVVDSSDIGSPATFAGTAYTGQASFLRYTLAGDTDLSGTVDSTDFNRFASGYGADSSTARWFLGDFNYDGTVDTLDFARLVAGFGQTLPAGAALPAGPGALVPEPASFALFACMAGVMTRRRRA